MNALQAFDMINGGIMSGLNAIAARQQERWEQDQRSAEVGNYNHLVNRYNNLVQRFEEMEDEAVDVIKKLDQRCESLKRHNNTLVADALKVAEARALSTRSRLTTIFELTQENSSLTQENSSLRQQLEALSKP